MNELNPTTKTNRRNAVSKQPTDNHGKSGNKIVARATKGDKVSLSETSKVKASVKGGNEVVSDVRQDLINKYRGILDSGTYVVKADELADKIVQKIREGKNRMVL